MQMIILIGLFVSALAQGYAAHRWVTWADHFGLPTFMRLIAYAFGLWSIVWMIGAFFLMMRAFTVPGILLW